MGFKFWKSLVLTAIIMALTIYVYVLADTYLYAVAAILNGILVVAGFLFIALLVLLIVYAEPMPRRQPLPWEQECRRTKR